MQMDWGRFKRCLAGEFITVFTRQMMEFDEEGFEGNKKADKDKKVMNGAAS